MKILLSEAGQCIVVGIFFLLIIAGFQEILTIVTNG